MSEIFLYILSIILIVSSSYFVAALFQSNRAQNTFLFWVLTIIAQVILSFELLSLVKQINIPAFLGVNSGFFLTALSFWWAKDKPNINKEWLTDLIKNIKLALIKDKVLFYLSVFFVFSSLVSLFLAIYAPTNLWDSMIYQVARVPFWIQQESLAHFETSSIRQVIFPPNSGVFLLWSMLFTKNDFLLGLSQYFSYLGSIFVIYSFLSYLKVSTRRILWAIFLFASLPAVIVQSSSTQDHLMLGFLLLSSLYLFIYSVFENDNKSLLFSALTLSISFGVKSSVFLFLPGLFIVYIIVAYKKQKWGFLKTAFKYFASLIPFLIIFSSYFYILNYFEFGHPLGLKSFIYEHTYMGKGFQSFIANFIRYTFSFFDFTGFDFAKILEFPYILIKVLIFQGLDIPETAGLMHGDKLEDGLLLLNIQVHDLRAYLGPLGFLVFLPLLIKTIKKDVFSSSKKTQSIALCGVAFIVFMLVISYLMGYMTWNNRYFITSAVIAAPMLALTYNPTHKPNFYKLLIFAVCVFCFVKIPLFNKLHPIMPVNNLSLLTNSREKIRYDVHNGLNTLMKDPVDYLKHVANDGSKIGIIFPESCWYYQFFEENPTWLIYPLDSQLLDEEKLIGLDYLVVFNKKQKVYNRLESNEYYKEVKINFEKISKYFNKEFYIKTKLNKETYKYYHLGQNINFYIFKRNSNK